MKKIKGGKPAVSGKFTPQDGEEFVIGMDHHKDTWAVAVYSQLRNSVVLEWVQPADVKVMLGRLKELAPGQVVWMVHEAGPTGYGAARALRKAGYHCDPVSASHVPLAPGDDQKCDRLDARRLAQCAARGELHVVSIPSEEEEGLRELTRLRARVARQRAKVRQSIRSFLVKYSLPEPKHLTNWSIRAVKELKAMKIDNVDVRWTLDMLLREMEEAIARLKEIDKRIKEVSEKESCHKKVEHLRAIGGIGVLTAMIVITEMYNPERFTNGEQVGQWLGLAPNVRSSGKTRRDTGRSRGGNKRLRTTLVEAAWRWIRKDPEARTIYNRTFKKTGSQKKAITAMARRLGIVCWKLLVTDQDYQGLDPKKRAEAQKAQQTSQPIAA